jgi:acetolactate synthase-1/2/3 large subunit
VPFARTQTPDELQSALGSAVRQRAPILIEARVGPMPSPWGLMRLEARPGVPNSGPPNPLGEPAR